MQAPSHRPPFASGSGLHVYFFPLLVFLLPPSSSHLSLSLSPCVLLVGRIYGSRRRKPRRRHLRPPPLSLFLHFHTNNPSPPQKKRRIRKGVPPSPLFVDGANFVLLGKKNHGKNRRGGTLDSFQQAEAHFVCCIVQKIRFKDARVAVVSLQHYGGGGRERKESCPYIS